MSFLMQIMIYIMLKRKKTIAFQHYIIVGAATVVANKSVDFESELLYNAET